jgi:hypothetical protein
MPAGMDAQTANVTNARSQWLRRAGWAIAVGGIMAAHVAVTLAAFGPDHPIERIAGDEPIISGRHPFHLYHAGVGAAAVRARGRCACYDTFLAAGYARTSAADFDSRPYEPLLYGAAVNQWAARYKMALAIWWSVLPLGFWASARIARLNGRTAFLATAFAVLLAGSGPGRLIFDEGDLGQAISSVLAVVHIACLVRCHVRPDIRGFAGLLVTAGLGWCVHPLIWGAAGLLSFGCWLGMFRRHSLRWHSAFGIAQGVAVALALPWLAEWVRYWWLTMPARPPTSGARFWANWDWPSWATATADRAVCIGLVLCGFVGGVFKRSGRRMRPMKWFIGSSIVITALALAAPATDSLAPFTAPAFLFLGFGLAVVPAASGASRWIEWQFRGPGRKSLGIVLGGLAICAAATWIVRPIESPGIPGWGLRPLHLGLPADYASLVDTLRTETQPTARILWEESSADESIGASILLPLLTERPILGAGGPSADADAGLAALVNGQLVGRPITQWTDADLEALCRRYNIGWIVAAELPTVGRLDRWPLVECIATAGSRRLYSVKRLRTYVLKGQARDFTADRFSISLADVVPENGEVVLSMHYQDGLRVRPGWVKIEREPDPYDPIPLIRLQMLAPAARVTLTWELR